MTIREKILEALQRNDRLCDDCLSEATGVTPRQAINSECRSLASSKVLARRTEDCPRCRRAKTINTLIGGLISRAERAVSSASVSTPSERPWYWEGLVQRRIVKFLTGAGYVIDSEADTASRQQGKDIIARAPKGDVLWVTVKGFPEKSSNVQARHWFAGALLDLALYRDQDANALLAMGLPAGFSTYEGLVARTKAIRGFLHYGVFWVNADGAVRWDEPKELAARV